MIEREKRKRKLTKIIEAINYIGEVIQLKFEENGAFTGKIDFTVNCKDGGIGSVEAYSRLEIKNGIR